MSTDPLIHIGFHKTGTTWLQQRFLDDPGTYMVVWPRTIIDEAFVGGNPFTFDAVAARKYIQPFLDQAEVSNTVPVVSHERLSGQPLLNGYDSAQIADRLHSTLPEGKVLIVIREQNAMLLSVYKQHVRRYGTEKIGDLWRGYSQRERRRPRAGLDFFEYHHIIGYYQQHFGRDRVLVLPFELLRADAVAFAGAISRFVGVEAPTEVPVDRENVGVPGILVGPLRVSNVVMRALGLEGWIGGPIPENRIGRARLRIINAIGPKIPPALSRRSQRRLQETIRRLTEGRFDESNRITADLTGIDLGGYGYATGAGLPS